MNLLGPMDSCSYAMERSSKKFKRQKIELSTNTIEDGSITIFQDNIAAQKKHCIESFALEDPIVDDRLVNWMSMEETQVLLSEKANDDDSTPDCDETDDSDEEGEGYREEDDINNDHKEADGTSKLVDELIYEVADKGSDAQCAEVFSGAGDPLFPNVIRETNEELPIGAACHEIEIRNQSKTEHKDFGSFKAPTSIPTSAKDFLHTGSGSLSKHKNHPKLSFCPKEVKRIIDSESLLQKNAHSHTIRKIIVFASLGIRHGCEDIYELDFNHFSILRKGEQYMSPKDPGEHVLYENPGVRRKIFYPNRKNPILCPVQILEEEKAMRPLDPSCPSFLFLCIKYGGKTRNLPQNEYVRQRMGRNKLKSFGPLMCRMAMLAHVRSGSFFFKALGITLLFMAGFPDDLVQRETKYRNLDLLQKYYRPDEDAEGEELFLAHPMTDDDTKASPGPQQFYGETSSTKTKGKKESSSKPHNMQKVSFPNSTFSSPAPQFGVMNKTSILPLAAPTISNTLITNAGTNISYHNPNPYHIFPPQPSNTFIPMVYWPPPNAFSPGLPYQSTYGYQSYPSAGNYFLHPQPYYNHPSCGPLVPKTVEVEGKNDMALAADSDYDCSSSSIEPKKN
ncbi:uncharacterized protein LOC126789378 isoform X2 [Argentina anserina]|uniref:uncharacterized protein LOC126789378 isoform X2 n=1 Tax=Argentina anserina TaxID=57926 RepID=UPI00217639B4|nr:uncharacterized protein LOC126789378 isoform X2 [Potentilla anserina]